MSRPIRDKVRVSIDHKICKTCLKDLPISEYFRKEGNKDGYVKECRGCRNLSNKTYRRRFFYNLTNDEYFVLFKKQDNRCAICGTHMTELKRTLMVDHDHSTNKIRGLLCANCNVGLGCFKDDYMILEKAIDYLKKGGINGEEKLYNWDVKTRKQ